VGYTADPEIRRYAYLQRGWAELYPVYMTTSLTNARVMEERLIDYAGSISTSSFTLYNYAHAFIWR
jgi:hypothetical protein